MSQLKTARMFIMVAACLFIVGTLGCESKEDSKLAKAQECLNKAVDRASAEVCRSMVEGMTNEKADLIRCAARFIENGLTGTRVSEAFNKLKSGSGGSQNATAAAMSFLTFETIADSDTVLEVCTDSRVRSMERLAIFASASTFAAVKGLAALGLTEIPEGGLTPAQMDQVLDYVKDNYSDTTKITADDQQRFGAIVIQMEDSFCGDGSAFKTNQVCKDLEAAVAGGADAAAIGAAFLARVKPD